MGKQVNYYMTADDEREFLEFVRSDRDVAVFVSRQSSQKIIDLDNNHLPKYGVPFWFSLCLWNRTNSPPPCLDYIKQQKHYCVDRLRSEVIEFSRSGIIEGLLINGRIWAEMSYYLDDGTLFHKSESFQKWYNRLATWIRRHAVKKKDQYYMLPGVVEFIKNGGKLR